MTPEEKRAAIQTLYNQLPNIQCQGKCSECCTGIGMSSIERETIRRAKGLIISHEKGRAKTLAAAPYRCPLLDRITLKCNAYQIRPMVCRLWGLTEGLRCPHGCQPDRVISNKEAYLLFLECDHISGDITEEQYARSKWWAEDEESWKIMEPSMLGIMNDKQWNEAHAALMERAQKHYPK